MRLSFLIVGLRSLSQPTRSAIALIEVKGFEFVRDRVLPMASFDKSLHICFGLVTSATEENVIAGLNSYINDIRQQAPNLLAVFSCS